MKGGERETWRENSLQSIIVWVGLRCINSPGVSRCLDVDIQTSTTTQQPRLIEHRTKWMSSGHSRPWGAQK